MDPITVGIVLVVVFTIAIIFIPKANDKDNTGTIYSNALNAIIQGDNSEAIKLLKQVVNRDSDNINAYLQLGNLLRSTNPQQSSKIHQALTVRPKLSKIISREIHQALALDYIELLDYKRAKIEAEMALKYDKKSLWANQLLLQIAEKQNDWASAGIIASKIHKSTGVRDNRQLAELQLQAGNDQLEQDENKKALSHYQNAIKLDPTYSIPYLHIGNMYEKENNLKKAIINWESYLTKTQDSPSEIYKKIESALFELGRFGEIEQFYNRILAQKPNDKNAVVQITSLLNDKGEIEKAIELIDSVINKFDDSIHARLIKIKILLEQANPVDLKSQIDEIIDRLDK